MLALIWFTLKLYISTWFDAFYTKTATFSKQNHILWNLYNLPRLESLVRGDSIKGKNERNWKRRKTQQFSTNATTPKPFNSFLLEFGRIYRFFFSRERKLNFLLLYIDPREGEWGRYRLRFPFLLYCSYRGLRDRVNIRQFRDVILSLFFLLYIRLRDPDAADEWFLRRREGDNALYHAEVRPHQIFRSCLLGMDVCRDLRARVVSESENITFLCAFDVSPTENRKWIADIYRVEQYKRLVIQWIQFWKDYMCNRYTKCSKT